MTEKTFTFVIPENDPATRLDVFLAARLPEVSRTTVKRLIKEGLILVDNSAAKANHRVRPGENVLVRIPAPPALQAVAEPIFIDIIHEDDDILIVNKQQGLTVHPAPGSYGGTLVNALLAHTDSLSNIGGPFRPGIVHRLDKDTSGVICVAKTNKAHRHLTEQFKEHTTERHYHALVWGRVKDKNGRIELAIGRDLRDRKKISARTGKARHAATNYSVIKRFDGPFTLLDVSPETGRTHQIRVHLTSIKHPIVGDAVYGKRTTPPILPGEVKKAIKLLKGQTLHAFSLGFIHPGTGEKVEFKGPYPAEMDNLLTALSPCS